MNFKQTIYVRGWINSFALIIIEASSSSPTAVFVMNIPDGEVEEEVSIIISASSATSALAEGQKSS
jgi:hypothetical protein